MFSNERKDVQGLKGEISLKISRVVMLHSSGEYGSLYEISHACHREQETLQRWCRCQASPSFESMVLFALETGASLDWIAFGLGSYLGQTVPFIETIRRDWPHLEIAEWWSAKELASAKMPDIPHTRLGVKLSLRHIKKRKAHDPERPATKRFGLERKYNFWALPLHWQMGLLAHTRGNTCMRIKL